MKEKGCRITGQRLRAFSGSPIHVLFQRYRHKERDVLFPFLKSTLQIIRHFGKECVIFSLVHNFNYTSPVKHIGENI